MANRRAFMGYGQQSMMQPASMMTPASSRAYEEQSENYQPMESPDTMRRRMTPITSEGMPAPRPSMMQELIAMLTGGQ